MHFSQLLSLVLPDALVAIIAAGVSFVLMQGVKEVLALFKIDLSKEAAALGAALVATLVAFLNGLLGQVPANLEPLVGALLQVLVVILSIVGPFGIFRIYRAMKRPDAKG